MRKTVKAVAFGALAVSLSLTAACSENKEGTGKGKGPAEAQAFIVDYDGKAPAPAKDVAGAKPGGTITILQDGDFEHLDPQQIYVSNALSYGSLFHRSLTGYIETGKTTDPLQLVGVLTPGARISPQQRGEPIVQG